MDIIELSKHNQQLAWDILENTHIVSVWESIGAKVNIVGSLKTGLLMKNKDIDMHIYTDELVIADSFAVMGKLAEKLALEEIQYKNLIDTEEECIEWHALYKDKKKNLWKFDMIHLRKGSKYDGVVEKVTDAIIRHLTSDIRRTILQIKYDMPDNVNIPGIEIYHAVFTGGVKNYRELIQYRVDNPLVNSLEWTPR
ncbi:phosphoglycerate mutase family protein [uncultured Parabacteroides sp.]|uniref:phosphoglycerate mutase family protein n=1 Tax=uncultured Parabacteroides sp. TaxID=512312 RepID=UPI002590701D|nr:phosphoglycerate mutase family protein [uncultured Parabacteroides sp.]